MPIPRTRPPRGLSPWRSRIPRPRKPGLEDVLRDDRADMLSDLLYPLSHPTTPSQRAQDFWDKTWPNLMRRALRQGSLKSFITLALHPQGLHNPRPLPPNTLSTLIRALNKPGVHMTWSENEQRHLAYHFHDSPQKLTTADWARWLSMGGWTGMDIATFGKELAAVPSYQASFQDWLQKSRNYPGMARLLMAASHAPAGMPYHWPQESGRHELVQVMFKALAPGLQVKWSNALAEALSAQGLPDVQVARWYDTLHRAPAPLAHPFWSSWMALLAQRPCQSSRTTTELLGWSKVVFQLHVQHPDKAPEGWAWNEDSAKGWGLALGNRWAGRIPMQFQEILPLATGFYRVHKALLAWNLLTPAINQTMLESLTQACPEWESRLLKLGEEHPEVAVAHRQWQADQLRLSQPESTPASPRRLRV